MRNKFIIWGLALILFSCSKIEPIEIIAPERTINTELLKQFKADLNNRQISIGMIYGWGKVDKSSLTHTPDSLDIIVVKDGYSNLTAFQKNDLAITRQKKATKVLIGIDLNKRLAEYDQQAELEFAKRKATVELAWASLNPPLTESQKKDSLNKINLSVIQNFTKMATNELDTISSNLIKNAEEFFDGISVEMPDNTGGIYTNKILTEFIAKLNNFAGKGKNYLLIIENPFTDLLTFSDQVNWFVFKQNPSVASLLGYELMAYNWSTTRFIPSADFSTEENIKGYPDSKLFIEGGKPSQSLELTHWNVSNKKGVAFYHIEADYTNIVGRNTYTALHYAINKLQASK